MMSHALRRALLPITDDADALGPQPRLAASRRL